MKLQVQSYNNGGTAYNAEAEETKFRTYSLEHEFNEPAKAIITLADTDGSMMQKYNGDANDVYLGVGKITIEDPDGTDIFFGRIKKVIGDSANKTVTLECMDWLDQLDEEQITYDMREKLSGNIRQSTLHTDPDNGQVGLRFPIANRVGAVCNVYDDTMAWANDAYNGMNLIFTSGMAGANTISTGPYQYALTGLGVDATVDTDLWSTDIEGLWTDDVNAHNTADNDEDWTVEYKFRLMVPDSTYFTSISGARIYIVYELTNATSGTGKIEFRDHTGAAWVQLAEIDGSDLSTYRRLNLEIPGEHLADITDGSGEANILITMDWTAGVPNLYVRYARFECDVVTTQDIDVHVINDTVTTNLLEVNESLDLDRYWEGVPYCIARDIYEHIDSAETPGTLITAGDGIVTLTCAATIEHTAGISTRQYKEKTRLEILRDLARQDKASLWVTLGGTTVTYKKTFGADTQQLTDGGILNWHSLYDYNQLTNEYHVYGAKIGDHEIYQSVTNAASVTKYLATRTKTLKNVGLVTDADAKELGTTLAARDAELSQMVACTIVGNTATAAHATTIKLGEIVEITSSYLWPTAAKDYIVTRFAYDSKEHKTYLTLQPKVSIGMQEIDTLRAQGEKVKQNMNAAEADKYVDDPITHTIS